MSAIESEASELHQARLPDKTTLARYYHQMLAIRRIEEALAKAYAQGKIGGFLHLYIGQEAVAVGAIAALKPDDYVVATYREHGHALREGHDARKAIMAELFGKATGCSKGLGGSMHLFDAEQRTSSAATASSAATSRSRPASRSRRSTAATAASRSASSATAPSRIGAFHEGVALAALWKLPIVFICENNQYSMGTPL